MTIVVIASAAVGAVAAIAAAALVWIGLRQAKTVIRETREFAARTRGVIEPLMEGSRELAGQWGTISRSFAAGVPTVMSFISEAERAQGEFRRIGRFIALVRIARRFSALGSVRTLWSTVALMLHRKGG